MSVTYGAGGSTRRNTVDIASKIKNINNIEALAHLTCIGATKKEIDEILKELQKRILVLDGAFYPEGHQETNDLLDLFNLKTKVDSGTDFLISQIFFENEKFYEFKEKLGKLNIKTPLIAGVMPITNGKQIRRITSMCGCSIPEKLKKILDRYEDNPIAMREAGIAYAMEQIIELISDDIAGIHIYTMNRVEASKKIMENIGNILRKRDENYGY
jgi:methylenetetrahydrofolate reductase (NADPH)